MKKLILFLACLIAGCSIAFLLPKACVTIKVVDDNDNPMENVWVGVGFERNTGSGVTTSSVHGKTDVKGLFTAKGKTTKMIGYVINRQQEYGVKGVNKEGYYNSIGKYEFDRVVGGEWQPWNPEIKVYLRKIENPVPMYARRFSGILPAIEKDIGLDLIAHDWVKPYGEGSQSDIIFNLKRKYVDDGNFRIDLNVKFYGHNDGFKKYSLDMYHGSEFKLPRYAPEDGYEKQFQRYQFRSPGQSIKSDEDANVGYVFRTRSNTISSVMYGKIQGDINISAIKNNTVSIGFLYYLNPDHTRNLEYDPKRNLFTDIKSYEPVGL